MRATCVVIMCDMRHVATASAATRGSLHAALPREPGDNNGAGMCVPTNSTLAEEAGSPSHGGGGPRGAKQRSGSAAAGGEEGAEEGGEVEEGAMGKPTLDHVQGKRIISCSPTNIFLAQEMQFHQSNNLDLASPAHPPSDLAHKPG